MMGVFNKGMLLLLLAVSVTSGNGRNDDRDDMKLLEDLEDIILRDGNIKAYFDRDGAGHQQHSRSPTLLLNQFHSISKSPQDIRKLKKLWKKLLKQNTPLSRSLPGSEIDKVKSSITDAVGKVESSTTCSKTSLYRSIDGTCNNLGLPEQGSSGTPLIRVVDNAYDDGLASPRTASAKMGSLPNARDVSRKVFDSKTRRLRDFTSLGIHFGQLIDHDITAVEAQEIECGECQVDNECFAITVDNSDPVFGGKQACFPFIRSGHESDSSGVRQQVNSITTWLDASFVYGSEDITAHSLIDGDKPSSLRHLTDGVTGRDLLPPNKDLPGCVGIDAAANVYCALAGDGRVAEQPGLTSLHTLFLREHNRIAEALQNLNPTVKAPEVYQKARKIVGAEWQHIVYNEYLPLITGKAFYDSKNLGPTAPYKYDQDVNAAIANVFAAAAFRFGHTEIPDKITRTAKNFVVRNIPKIQMKEAFFNASYMFDESIPNGAVDSILRGMAVQRLDTVDKHLTSAVTDNLFGDPDVKGDGFDLASLNIQRARDHGLPSYTVIREKFCGFEPINGYKGLKGIMCRKNIRSLRRVYGRRGVKDIDPFVGFLLETRLPNILVGPTLACIFADQFHRLKFGDRFFYKNPDQFTKAEMEEIEKVTMARLMCDNVEGISRIQPYVFMRRKNYKKAAGAGKRKYASFYKFSRSGDWPAKITMLAGLNNRRAACTQTDRIPSVDLTKFTFSKNEGKNLDEP